MGFPGGSVVKKIHLPSRRHGSGTSPGGGHGNPLQYFCWENVMDRGPGRLQSIGLQRIRHNLATKQWQQQLYIYMSYLSIYMYIRYKILKRKKQKKEREKNKSLIFLSKYIICIFGFLKSGGREKRRWELNWETLGSPGAMVFKLG